MKALILALLLLAGSAYAELELSDAGLWYEPANPGHGIQVNTWLDSEDRVVAAIFWYTYDLEGGQAWYLVDNIVSPNTDALLYRPGGLFPSQGFDVGLPVGDVRINKLDDGRLKFEATIDDLPQGCTGRPQSVPVPFCFADFSFERLSPARD